MDKLNENIVSLIQLRTAIEENDGDITAEHIEWLDTDVNALLRLVHNWTMAHDWNLEP